MTRDFMFGIIVGLCFAPSLYLLGVVVCSFISGFVERLVEHARKPAVSSTADVETVRRIRRVVDVSGYERALVEFYDANWYPVQIGFVISDGWLEFDQPVTWTLNVVVTGINKDGNLVEKTKEFFPIRVS